MATRADVRTSAAVGIALCLGGGWLTIEGIRSNSWPATDGIVLKTGVIGPSLTNNDVRDYQGGTVRPRVEYRYEAAGRTYVGDRITMAVDFAGLGEGDYRVHALEVVSRYPAGSRVAVRYKPSDPAIAVLEPGPSRQALWAVFGGAVLLVYAWARRER